MVQTTPIDLVPDGCPTNPRKRLSTGPFETGFWTVSHRILYDLSGARRVTSGHHSFHINLIRRRRSVQQHQVDHSTTRGCLQILCSPPLLKLQYLDLPNRSHDFILERPRVTHHSSNSLSITIKDLSRVPTTPQFLSILASNPHSEPYSLRTHDLP